MDPRLLRYYNQELQHVREMGAEFARQFPKIAARLGVDGIEVSDPYVERLLEGFAFLAARVQLKLDAEFPRFTQRMLEILYPQFLAPTPSMLIAQFRPDMNDGNLARGFRIPRGSSMRSLLGKGDATACEFRTAHDVRLLPLEVASASYFSYAPDLPLPQLPGGSRIRGGLRIRLRAGAGLKIADLDLASLPIYLGGGDDTAMKLYELALGACAGVLVLPPERPAPWYQFVPPAQVRTLGFDDHEALLPVTLRGFQGYRLVHEYFAFPQRFTFVDVHGLGAPARRCAGSEIEIVLLFLRGDAALESVVGEANVNLFCTPAINLFTKRAERIQVGDGSYEFHVVADRTRPMDFEIHDIESVIGYGAGGVQAQREFLPFYAAFHSEAPEHPAYFTQQREPRLLSPEQQRNGTRSSYIGSEVFLALVDPEEAPYAAELRQLAVTALCTNRDLSLQMPVGVGKTDLTLDSAAPLACIRVLKGPSRPLSSLRQGNVAWQFINHLSLNYLSLLDNDARQGAAVLREMLELYALGGDGATLKQIEGLRSVKVRPLVRRFPLPGPVSFGRGLEVELEVDELAFQGASPFLFGAVMERFLTRYVSINSFTETVLRSSSRGEIMRWVPRCGNRPIV
jgi:type VI secretion system protein ImpG